MQTDSEHLAEDVMRITSAVGVRVVFDPIGGPLLTQLADAAASGATLIEYGALASSPTPFPLFPALAKGLTLRGYTLFETVKDPEKLTQAKHYVYTGLQSGALKPIIDSTFPLSDIDKAHDYMASNRQRGKIVVTV